jgi:CelD/BcsL family acetyltransferase involved in cellulose biosynthesis
MTHAQIAAALALQPPSRPTAPDPSAPVAIEVRHDLEISNDDVVAIDRMLAARPDVSVFLSRPWLSGFFSDPPSGVKPALVLVRLGHLLRGVAPVAIRRTRGCTHVSLLGGAFGSDRVDLVGTRGFETVASDAFIGWLAETFGRDGFLLELRDVPSTSALWGAIHRATDEGKLRGALQPRDVATLPYLDLKERPSAVPSAAPATASARSLAKHRRWLENRCQLRIDLLDTRDEVMDAFGSLVSFLHARWRGGHDGSALDDPRTRRFHEAALPRLLTAGCLRMIRLTADGERTIAVFYGMARGTWWGYYLCGYDREWAGRIRLGQLTLDAAIDLARREGAAEFDFLKGAHRNKYAWPVRERTTLDADLFSEAPGAQLTRAARAARDAVAAVGKAGRSLMPR